MQSQKRIAGPFHFFRISHSKQSIYRKQRRVFFSKHCLATSVFFLLLVTRDDIFDYYETMYSVFDFQNNLKMFLQKCSIYKYNFPKASDLMSEF